MRGLFDLVIRYYSLKYMILLFQGSPLIQNTALANFARAAANRQIGGRPRDTAVRGAGDQELRRARGPPESRAGGSTPEPGSGASPRVAGDRARGDSPPRLCQLLARCGEESLQLRAFNSAPSTNERGSPERPPSQSALPKRVAHTPPQNVRHCRTLM